MRAPVSWRSEVHAHRRALAAVVRLCEELVCDELPSRGGEVHGEDTSPVWGRNKNDTRLQTFDSVVRSFLHSLFQKIFDSVFKKLSNVGG